MRPIEYLNNFTVAFNEIADLKAEIQEATGALKFFTGGDDPVSLKRTATEVSALVSGGTQKFSHFMSHLEKSSLVPFLHMTFENAKQFMRGPETIRVTNHDGSLAFLEILPEVLQQADCCFKVDGSKSSLLKEQEMNALVAFIEMSLKDPELRQQIDVMELYRKIYRRLGFRDEDQVFHHPLAGRPDSHLSGINPPRLQ
nr:hypothetical protein 1 [bacterium]